MEDQALVILIGQSESTISIAQTKLKFYTTHQYKTFKMTNQVKCSLGNPLSDWSDSKSLKFSTNNGGGGGLCNTQDSYLGPSSGDVVDSLLNLLHPA